MRSRDIADWTIAATSLLLGSHIWIEDQDSFGTDFAIWTTAVKLSAAYIAEATAKYVI